MHLLKPIIQSKRSVSIAGYPFLSKEQINLKKVKPDH